MKKVYILMLVCCLILIGLFIFFQIDRYDKVQNGDGNPVEDIETLKVYLTSDPESEPVTEAVAEPSETLETETDTETEPPVPEPTLDFEKLWEVNGEVCAWIEINGTVVDYPVLMSPSGYDNKYLTTALNGQYYVGGSLFIQEKYNSRDFNDRVTVIYGHTMPDESIFGQLQRIYSNPATFMSHNDIKLYLPDEVRHYEVFAAVPFDKTHITATYDFTSDYWYKSFFKRVADVRELSACFNNDAFPEIGDRVLILSTCLNEDPSYRYLVMAVNRDDMKK